MGIYLYFASILMTCALFAFLAAYAWRHRQVPGGLAFTALASAFSFLALFEALSMLGPTPAWALSWFKLRFLFTATVPVFWLIFALEYSGRKEWLSRRLMAGIFLLPAITQVLLWSNGLHGLWVRQEVAFHRIGPFWIALTGVRVPGFWFFVYSLYGLALLLAGIVLLLAAARRARRDVLGQSLFVGGAAFLVFAVAIVVTFNLNRRAEFNPLTPGIGLSVFLVALAIFRFHFLKRAPRAEPGSKFETFEVQTGRPLAAFIFIFILLVAGIAAIGFVSIGNYQRQFRKQAESQIAAIAQLKVGELRDWRAERLADANVLLDNPVFAALVERFFAHPADARARADLQAWLGGYQAYRQYDRLSLLDTRGVERLSVPPPEEAEADYLEREAAASLTSRRVVFLDIHRDQNDRPVHLSLLVSLSAGPAGGGSPRPQGVLVMRVDPAKYLYPLIKKWPVPSASGETLIVRRDGEDVLFLNDLRFNANAACNLRLPLTRTNVPAVRAALGQEGLVEGPDYRGVLTLAALLAVPDSPWFLVARVDSAEIFAPLRERLWQMASFFGALIVAAGTGLGMAWRHQRARYYRGRVEAMRALREKESALDKAQRVAHLGNWLWHVRKNWLEFSDEMFRIFGIEKEKFAGRLTDVMTSSIHPDDRAAVERSHRAVIKDKWAPPLEYRVVWPDGTIRWVWTEMSEWTQDRDGHTEVLSGVALDITERKRAEEALQAVSERQKAVLAAIPDIIMEVDRRKFYTWANRPGLDFFGEDVIGKEASFYFEGEQATYDSVRPLFDGSENVIYVESWQRRKDGVKRLLAWWWKVLKDDAGNVIGALSSARDITDQKLQEMQTRESRDELRAALDSANQSRRALLSVIEDRKRAEEAVRASTELYRLIAENSTDVIWTLDRDFRYTYISPSIRKLRGLEPEEAMRETLEQSMAPESYRLVREQIDRNIKGFERGQPIFARAEVEQYRKDGSMVWVEVITQTMYDREKRFVGYLGASRDISDRKRAEDALRNTLTRLRRVTSSIIDVIAKAVETRDPYTAGHQKRVSDLARAIAGQMALPPDQIEGIRVAAAIHDLGKISIPAELLSMPRKLTAIEYDMVKIHSQAGANILKGVEFDWPVAQIIAQHHERMNGSGYPAGLKGEAILLDARIIAVADVVEAIASHRPYRPAHGIDAALEEIEKNRGSSYDPAAVDACVALFREKGYTFVEA